MWYVDTTRRTLLDTLLTLPLTAHLDSSPSIQRLLPLPLRRQRNQDPLQGLPRQHRALEAR